MVVKYVKVRVHQYAVVYTAILVAQLSSIPMTIYISATPAVRVAMQ
jgi:hypothetical protein